MSERSFHELSNLTEVAVFCYSPIANDELRRVTSHMLEEAENENSEIICEQVSNNDIEQLIEKEQSTRVVPNKKKQKEEPPEFPIYAKISSERETPEAGSSQGFFNLLQEIGQYETASDEDTPGFEKTSHLLAVVPQNADLHIYLCQCTTCCVLFTGKKT